MAFIGFNLDAPYAICDEITMKIAIGTGIKIQVKVCFISFVPIPFVISNDWKKIVKGRIEP